MQNNITGYSPKDIRFEDDCRSKLIEGVKTISRAVKSTLGPSGNTVLIESMAHTHGITVTKDGVTVAKSIELMDPVENLAVRMMKEAADKTATTAGDGTTTAIVLTEALVLLGSKYITNDVNRTNVLRHLNELSADVVASLQEKSIPCTPKIILDVATISSNNDPKIGKVISDMYIELGGDGIVTVEKSQTESTYTETTMGLKIDRGFTTDAFINNQDKDECILEDVHVLVCDVEIDNVMKLERMLTPFSQTNLKLLMIATCTPGVTQTLAKNVSKGNFKLCIIPPPNFGYKQHELMQDIAVSVGATYLSDKTGDDLSHLSFDDLGHAKRAIINKSKTVLVRSSNKCDENVVTERVEQLRKAHLGATNKIDKEFIMQRIASLTGGVGVIYVGGNTDLEQKELYDRVDDAVCAVRSAIDEGVLPGAGVALYRESYRTVPSKLTDEFVANLILSEALHAPISQILANAGINYEDIYKGIDFQMHTDFGYNLKTQREGNMVEMGVVDPLKVTRIALQNAVSVAITILSTNAVITMARTYETK
jgi:chaperonin GroEL